MESVNALVAIIGGLLALIVAVAAAVAMARASFAKAQIEALRGDRDDLTARVQMLESENLRVSQALQVEQQARKVLERVVTGKEQLDHLQATLDTFVTANKTWRDEQRTLGLDILALLGGQRDGEVRSS